jgi:hypothetical protein
MTSTFIAGLRHDGIIAPCLFNCAIDGELFLAYVEQQLAPSLSRATYVCEKPVAQRPPTIESGSFFGFSGCAADHAGRQSPSLRGAI